MIQQADEAQGVGTAGGEDAHWFIGELIRVCIPGEQTGERFSLVEHAAARGVETPWHVQPGDDEAWYVIEGELSFWIGDSGAPPVTARPGSTVLAPRGVPHAFRVDSETARYVTVHTPAGHERFYRQAGEPARELAIPPSAEADMPRLMEACAQHDIEILGPPPGAQ